MSAHWEHFTHDADIGVRGIGNSKSSAFTEAAKALIAVITDPNNVAPKVCIHIHCEAPDDELLLVDWLNELIFEITTRDMLFGHFDVDIKDTKLTAQCCGEQIDPERHHPTVEIKGATYTELSVRQDDKEWVAQTVVDV